MRWHPNKVACKHKKCSENWQKTDGKFIQHNFMGEIMFWEYWECDDIFWCFYGEISRNLAKVKIVREMRLIFLNAEFDEFFNDILLKTKAF